MTAKEFFESQLITDANSAINKNNRSFNHYDVIKFAELYGITQYNQAISESFNKMADIAELILNLKK